MTLQSHAPYHSSVGEEMTCVDDTHGRAHRHPALPTAGCEVYVRTGSFYLYYIVFITLDLYHYDSIIVHRIAVAILFLTSCILTPARPV